MSCVGFGELNIPSSRAFWDDCEEDEPLQQAVESLKLNFELGQSETPIRTDVFLLIEGLNTLDFAAKTLLEHTKKICSIPAQKFGLFVHEEKNLLLAVLEENLNDSGEITELLLPYAKEATDVITLTLKSKVEYKSEEYKELRDEIVILHGINTKLDNVKELEAPNFIAGIAAGIASWRASEQLPVSSYVVYTDKLPLDAISAQPVLKLLQNLGVPCAKSYTPRQQDDSYLYS